MSWSMLQWYVQCVSHMYSVYLMQYEVLEAIGCPIHVMLYSCIVVNVCSLAYHHHIWLCF